MASPPQTTRLAHVFRDGADGPCLFVRALDNGRDCQAQLVYHIQTGEHRVRKVLAPRVPASEPPTARERRFDADVNTARTLFAAAAGRTKLRIPEVLSDRKTVSPDGNKSTCVSYWRLCNGGSIGALLNACKRHGASLPRVVVFRLLRHVLETLELMYQQCERGPVFHLDLSDENLLLDFNGAEDMPELYVIDLGRAGRFPLPRRDRSWDVVDVLYLAECLVSQTSGAQLPGQYQRERNWRGYLSDEDYADAEAFCEIYQALLGLGERFEANATAASHRDDDAHPELRHGDVPSLQPVIDTLQARISKGLSDMWLKRWQPGTDEARFFDFLAVYRQRTRLQSASDMSPTLYDTQAGILGAANVHGPWFVGRVDELTFELQGGPLRSPYHRPNKFNSGSETEGQLDLVSDGGSDEEECNDNNLYSAEERDMLHDAGSSFFGN
ncbi:hypothetical protein B0T26DRAFT_747172 [Lasiosphaeria miniovina]|uniref:Protein kinase domain-containing protein n=1 Tax=Lasiosphaeria miniovina TaxID=1954250 RepID=A0AA40B356_9PEZI|nr:uncharacterized protein B0T26DRAFT_747172 [Lasiosphaeria miniovina]KAK0726765.1 hypothetical protein B0T26DRAFT_747172 [Lasiosphaeria miniovina]